MIWDAMAGKDRSVGARIVLLINPSREYTRRLLGGFAQYARLHTSWTFYRPLEYREPRTRGKLMPVLKELEPDGILMREPAKLDQIIQLGVPIVCSPYTRESVPGVINVITDHEAVGRMAAIHLLDRGLRRFGYCGFDDWWWSRRRRDVFCQTVREAGFEADIYRLPRAKSERTWARELPRIGRWLSALPKPAGVMTCNDDRGELVIEACKAAGVAVPDEVAVIGVDNDNVICDLCSPALSSVATNPRKVAYEAAAVLDGIIQGRRADCPTLCIEPTHVATRQSSDIMAASDPVVVAALRFIREQARQNLGVQQVVEHVGLSRRAVEKRFQTAIGHSVYAEIQRVRLQLFSQMLTQTQMPVAEVAAALNFPDAAHASRFFRKGTGLSPARYRRQHLP